MKILMLNCTNKGSVGKIINSISAEISNQGGSFLICHGLGDPTDQEKHIYKTSVKYEPGFCRRVTYLTGMPYGFAPFSTLRIIRLIIKERPDIVHIHCPNGATVNVYKLITWLKNRNYPVVITNHCEMFYTANCPHSYDCIKWKNGCSHCEHLKEYVGPFLVDRTSRSWKTMRSSFSGFKHLRIVSVSNWVYERAKLSFILGEFNNIVIENGINENVYKIRNDEQRNKILKRYGIPENKKIALFVTANFVNDPNENKGGYFLLKLAQNLDHENILFVIVAAKGTISDLPKNVISLGRVENEVELSKLYTVADVSIVLSKKETFSMPCAESLCCGTPVIGFKAGGPESISISEFSEFVPYGDIKALTKTVKNWIDKKDYVFIPEKIEMMAHERYSNKNMIKKYIQVYNDLINEGKGAK